ncbi:MAG TPA: SDR family NAD(P)-dependent oxidoreductase [Candidatus Limnocylindria bacterium]|nr:SDR family NAD(P)-dependent oxidoreductase [Candidatus Limnocylindria bacterium]
MDRLAGRMALGATGGIIGAALARRLAEQLTADDLSGEVALVTGGSRGFGLLLARELGRAGCSVAICARDAAELEKARAWLAGEDVDATAEVCDVAHRQPVEALIGRLTDRLGPIDVLVNNAGIISVGALTTMDHEEFRRAQDVMFWGTLNPTLAVLPAMRARRHGRIVNVTSIGGRVSAPHLLPYNSAKFAAVGLSEGLRAELGRDGIHVTTVVPWLMRTGSYVRAVYRDPAETEFAWFSLGASLPLVSTDAERAARQVIGAVRRRSAVCAIGFPAAAATAFHGLFPGLTADILGFVNRFLPAPGGPRATDGVEGRTVEPRLRSKLFRAATALGRRSGERFGER